MNASTQLPSVETALNSERVRPAEKGCYDQRSPIRIPYLWCTATVFIPQMDVFDMDLDIVDDL